MLSARNNWSAILLVAACGLVACGGAEEMSFGAVGGKAEQARTAVEWEARLMGDHIEVELKLTNHEAICRVEAHLLVEDAAGTGWQISRMLHMFRIVPPNTTRLDKFDGRQRHTVLFKHEVQGAKTVTEVDLSYVGPC